MVSLPRNHASLRMFVIRSRHPVLSIIHEFAKNVIEGGTLERGKVAQHLGFSGPEQARGLLNEDGAASLDGQQHMTAVGLHLLTADEAPLQKTLHGPADAVLGAAEHLGDALRRQRSI